jgi:hypothetical protein
MFPGIDSNTFINPEFKEDAVREFILAPMVRKLGYLPTGDTRVTLSKTLRNPFIRVGTTNHPVTTVPDYTFYINNQPLFVLDAKSPSESVLNLNHIQQAYSYAIHPEIRCEQFGLCNGKEIAIFNVSQYEPLLHLKFEEFEKNWNKVEEYLTPKYLSEPHLRKFAPDYGLALMRMGFTKKNKMHMMGVRLNLFAKVDQNIITASANTDLGFGAHCVSFDFHPDILHDITSGLPNELGIQFIEALNRAPFKAAAGLAIELDLTVILGNITQLQSGEFVPLMIQKVNAARFNPSKVANDPSDIPPHVYKLREHFKIQDGDESAYQGL